jgi:hypothetical protein
MTSDRFTLRIIGDATGIQPMTTGVPLPRGACRDVAALTLTADDRRRVPLQARALAQWGDGSVKWALLDFQHDAAGGGCYTVDIGRGSPASYARPLRVDATAVDVRVDTGIAEFRMTRGDRLLTSRHLDLGMRIVGRDRRPCELRLDEVAVEETGPLRSVVRLAGVILQHRQPLLDVVTRLHFFAGLATVRVCVTLTNPRAAEHSGGFWELGDRASVFLTEVACTASLADIGPGRASCSPERDLPTEASSGRLELYQESSGGANWASSVHVNRDGRVPLRFRGYRLADERTTRQGLRATPLVAVEGDRGRAALTMPYFWQNFPKAIEATADSMTLGLWPSQYGDLHEIQGGEQKTHVLYVSATGSAARVEDLSWCRTPSIAVADPDWYCAAGAIPWLSPAARDLDPEHLELVDAAIQGPASFESKREFIDEYGWRHFGDLYADHESVGREGGTPFASHYNNQYDAIAGFASQFAISGDTRWWRAMDELAAHVIDIDIYHTARDKSAYGGGMFWHTYHYLDAGRSTHRSYPRGPATSGGGPSDEHNYNGGLLLHYFLTGNRLSLDAALGLARWVVNMDDGRQTVFRWMTTAPTGLASATGSPDYHGPGRGAGNSIKALLNGYSWSRERDLLEKAETIIQRCVHPDDDIAALRLLDRETRWSYTVFLQALGAYLQVKDEEGLRDEAFEYARAALLHYARWMAEHEFPYLDRPEMLEYPTETWAAQDARKSEVFDVAARHTRGGERLLFLERAEFFWRHAVRQLASMPTRTLTRPVVIMAGHGFLRAKAKAETVDATEPRPPTALRFPPRQRFVPQKARVLTRLRLAAGACGGTGVALLLWWILA